MSKPWKELGRYGAVGVEIVLTILLLGWAGRWLDERYWAGRGWGMAIGFLLGVAIAVRNLIRTSARMQKDIERAEAADPEGGRWTVDDSWIHDPESRDGVLGENPDRTGSPKRGSADDPPN